MPLGFQEKGFRYAAFSAVNFIVITPKCKQPSSMLSNSSFISLAGLVGVTANFFTSSCFHIKENCFSISKCIIF